MGSVRTRSDNGYLFFDFRYMGKRYREQTLLNDTKVNRKKMEALLQKIEDEISMGIFNYLRYFPDGKMVEKLYGGPISSLIEKRATLPLLAQNQEINSILFETFANTWFDEMKISWRRSYIATMRLTLDKYLIAEFGGRMVHSILREDLLAYRSSLGKAPGRKGKTLSSRRINAIMLAIKQILNEAADRYHFNIPTQRIKPLKVRKVDIAPFSFDEVQRILNSVRVDYLQYFTVRFFTGMRTGEVDGLKWKHVDFERRQILIRETLVCGEMEDDAKTELSIRDIYMSDIVYQALKIQFEATATISKFVFCNMEGNSINLNNFTKRVWAPLLRHLNLDYRKPYMMRHTAATLWLASGENPEWIAKQLGHSSTEMLFKVYSRFVPNMTRQGE
jgi:integrase